MSAGLSRLGAGRRDEPDLVESERAETPICPRDQHLVDARRRLQQELEADRTHEEALHQRFIDP